MMNNASVSKVHLAAGGESLISSSGLSLLAQTASASALSDALSAGLLRWRKPTAVHGPGKVVLDLVLAIAAGGDCLADVSLIRAQPERSVLPARQRGRRFGVTAVRSLTITRWSLIWTRL